MSEEFMVIRGKEIPINNTRLAVINLQFYPENPRIYSAIGADESNPTQEEIQDKLSTMDHVKELVHDIKLNGDLLDPIIVKDGSFEVLEGNSRLAAYRLLAEQDPIKWGTIRSTVLPQNIDESLIFALLGQYHIKGKKDWQPYEQAGFLHRRHKRSEISIDKLAKELGLQLAEAKNLVQTYEFMVDHGVKNPTKWSYFYEFIKSRKIKKYRNDYGQFDTLIVKKVDVGEVGTAMQFRDGLKKLGDAKPNVVKKFVEGTYSFEQAIEATEESGNSNEVYKRLRRFRMWLIKTETKETIKSSKGEQKKKMDYELKKISAIIKPLTPSS